MNVCWVTYLRGDLGSNLRVDTFHYVLEANRQERSSGDVNVKVETSRCKLVSGFRLFHYLHQYRFTQFTRIGFEQATSWPDLNNNSRGDGFPFFSFV